MKLQEKGWSETDIKHAESVLKSSEKHDIYLSQLVFWSALVVIIFANILVSLILIPFLIALNRLFLFAIIGTLGLTIGFLYNFLITDIGHLRRKHHIAAGIIVPALAVMNMLIMVVVANRFIVDIKIENQPHDPWLIAATFAIAFIIPYLIDSVRMEIQSKRYRSLSV